MAEKDNMNLDLDDIIREFSEKPAAEKFSETKKMEDTIPLEDIVQASHEQVNTQEKTQRFAPVEETREFTPVAEETREIPVLKSKEMEDTVNIDPKKKPEKPKTLRTPFQIMRRKIVEGPERQYYALQELGFAKIKTVMLLSFLVAVLSIGVTILYAMGYVPAERLRLVIFGQFLLMLLSALLGAFQLVDGLFLLGKLRFRPNTLLAFTFIACCIDGCFCLMNLRVPCSTVFCIQVFMSLWGSYLQRTTETCRTDTMRSAKLLAGLSEKKNYADGIHGLLRCEGDVDDFMNAYGKEGAPEKILGWYCLGAFGASAVLGIVIGLMNGTDMGVQVFATALLASMPATMFITLTRAARQLERKLYKLGVVICGWRGVKGLAKKAYFPLTHKDIFPEGTVKLNGVKFYGSLAPATVVGYAAAVAKREDGSLAPLFAELKSSYYVEDFPVDSFKTYAGGIGGGVDGCVVLVGTLPMLKAMNVKVPEDIKMLGGIGVAVDGMFSCLLAVNYERVRPVAHGLSVLCGCAGLTPVLISDDLMLSGSFMQKKFHIRPKKIYRPSEEERLRLRSIAVDEGDKVLALCVRPSLPAYGYVITGAKALHNAVVLGVIIHILGGALGLGAVAVLAFLGQTALLSPLNILLYQAIWLIPGFLLTEWTRAI
ncbi:MAG: hypothetical protein E7435_06430 [Ruminococcaceae bacterium]|nr:hypothetical protein [Oscillospiraceae bacterium]